VLLDRFEERWRRFQAALPFNEVEGRWFLHEVNAGLDVDDVDITVIEEAEELARQEATIITAGVHKVVSGRELLRAYPGRVV
jgi:hypothetical protein